MSVGLLCLAAALLVLVLLAAAVVAGERRYRRMVAEPEPPEPVPDLVDVPDWLPAEHLGAGHVPAVGRASVVYPQPRRGRHRREEDR